MTSVGKTKDLWSRRSWPNVARLWPVLSLGLICWAMALAAISARFGYDFQVVDMPIFALTFLLVVAGLVYFVFVPGLVTRTVAGASGTHATLALMIFVGLAARVILFTSEPILEDDYQRYLWDAAVTASGNNPYAYSPKAVIDGGSLHPLAAVAARSGAVLERIGHAQLTTIYPPLAQSAFALANQISPFNLTAWRGILIAFDVATLAMIVACLNALARSPLWATLYWWNPLVIKETFNAAHMDGLLAPFILAGLLLAHRRPYVATAALGIAFGIKFWPVLLLPLIWRPLLSDWRRLGLAVIVFIPFAGVALWPQMAAGLDREAGLVAYASSWSRNSALTPALAAMTQWIVGDPYAALVSRGLIAVVLATVVIGLAWRPIASLDDLTRRATFTVGALLLLSPAQYPWYSIWLAPLLALHPIPGFLLLPAVLPLYELFFYFAAREMPNIFNHYIVWAIWIPVWAMLFAGLRERQHGCRATMPINLRRT